MSTGPIIKGEDRPHGFARGPFSRTSVPKPLRIKASGEVVEKVARAIAAAAGQGEWK